MKKFNVLITLALAFALGAMFTACELDTAVRVTVRFQDPSGGNYIPDLLIAKGTSMGSSLPALPERQGLTFHGWYDNNTRYDADTIVSDDVTLTARWSDDVVTVSFEFSQTDSAGEVIVPTTAAIPDLQTIRGIPISPRAFPVTPRAKGWVFAAWLLYGEVFTQDTPVPGDITLVALWLDPKKPGELPPGVELPPGTELPAAKICKVTIDPGPGGGAVQKMDVVINECIDEWEVRFPPKPTNTLNTKAFFVAWFDNENREYDGRTVITRDVTITAKWGLPPKIINFNTEAEVQNYEPGSSEGTSFQAEVADSILDGSRVIVNKRTYDVPDNSNRWRILYRIKLNLPDDFNIGFYTRYTIRARFFVNRQGAATWPTDPLYKEGQFIPNIDHALPEQPGYSQKGLLTGNSSPSNDGWGQVSFTSVANWNGQGADADTMLQRYNLDRKGGTINDTWAPLRGNELPYPPYLIIQTSDNFIGHIEVRQIVFHNGEKKYTMYEDEEGYDEAEDGLEDEE